MDLQAWKLSLAPAAWAALRSTMRLVPPQAPVTEGPVLFACLHRDILPAIVHVAAARPVLMVSDSPDGDILVRTLGHRNYDFVRGSSEEHGERALIGLCRLVEAGRSAGVAVDGPKGPFGLVRDGVVHLARRTGAPIIPLKAEARRALTLGTWDRTLVPLPFARVRMSSGGPLFVPRDADQAAMAAVRSRLQEFFGVGEVDA